MPRQQEFNTQEVVGKAMHVFWRKGYKGASMHELLNEMGIGKGSFYATFGSKRELFMEALKLYGDDQALISEASNLLSSLQPRTSIEMLFERAIDRAVNEHRCCMFGKTSLEFWQTDPEIAEEVSQGVLRVEEKFRNLVIRGQKEGDINIKHDPESLANFLTGVFYGLQVMASAVPNRKALEDTVSTTLAMLD